MNKKLLRLYPKHGRHRRWLTVILLCTLLQLAGARAARPLYAQDSLPNFTLQHTFPVTAEPFAIATGDLNGDGAFDLIIGHRGQNVIHFMDGDGVIRSTVAFGGAEQTVDVAVGDLNGDGALEIVAYNSDGPSVVYQHDGAGNFALLSTFPAASGSGDQVNLGDLDGDGDYDLVAARAQGSSTVYQNNGQGNFTALRQLAAGFSPFLIDEDRDGDLDLLLLQRESNPATSALYRLRNNGSALFTSTRLTLPGGKPFPQQVAAADLDGDGDLDFVLSSITLGCTGNACADLRLVLSQGLLGFTTRSLDAAAASTLTLVDVDNDGDLDIATTGLAADSARLDDRQSKLFLNNGSTPLLGFNALTAINVGAPQLDTRDLAVADLDSDGLPDFVLGSAATIGIYRHTAGQFFDRCTANLLLIDPQLLADFNGDSYPDLILRSGLLLLNNRAGAFQVSISLPLVLDLDARLAAADLNGDGRLDLVAVYQNRPAVIYLQTANGQFVLKATLDQRSFPATSIAIGDINSDGHLDLVLGRGSAVNAATLNPGQNLIYRNDGTGAFAQGQPVGPLVDNTQSMALGDLDADGDLDLVVGNALETQGQQQGQQNYLYFNDGLGHFGAAQALGPGTDRTRAIAIGDLNGDGQLDLLIGNAGQLNAIYFNDGSGRFPQAQAVGQLPDDTDKVILVDLDHDRDLDLIVSNRLQPAGIYTNAGQGQFTAAPTFAEPTPNARAFIVAAGDLDRDGDVDLVADLQALSILPNLTDCILFGQRVAPVTTPGRLPRLLVTQPGQTVGAGPYASPQFFAQGAIPLTYTLFDPEGKPVDIQAYYSLDGGGQWFPALPAAGVVTKNLPTRNGAAPVVHTFLWDVYASNFLGHSDLVLFRIEALASRQPIRSGRPGLVTHPYVAAETYPLRVRGTQVRVIREDGAPVTGALLYKLPVHSTARADTFPLRNGLPVRTNPLGFIEGRGQLSPGDQLIALAPISATHAFTLYHTSAAPTLTGLDAFVVQAAGIQTLTVAADYPLTLFNLRLALEWDARNDGTFLTDLQNAVENTSAVLFDVTEGQVALGDVTIYQGKAEWNNADVVINASNSIHPRATMGGIVITPTAEIGLNGLIPQAYWPGQIRMGPQWDPFGQNEAELRQDWWLAFAHELAHYLFFLPDNYLGIEQGRLRSIDCQGSFMTNTYEEPYREFLTRDRWDQQEVCWRQSIAAHTTGRADWQTLQHFLPWLHAPATATAVNPGPLQLPLQVTRVRLLAPSGSGPATVLSARYFDLRDASGGEITRLRQAEGYLFKTRGTPQLEDDELIALGSTGAGSDRIKVRGAEPGDRICMLQRDERPVQVGCETVTANSTSIRLHRLANWQPEIIVSPINSTTLAITVTQAMSPGVALRLQILPAYPDPAQPAGTVAPWVTLQPLDANQPHQFYQRITLAQPVFEGAVRVWAADQSPAREAITTFFLNAGWGPNTRPTSHANRAVWGPNTRPTSHAYQRAWGANSRSMAAPVASGDGKVTIINLDNLFDPMDAIALQALSGLPELPLWLTPIGSGYRVSGSTALTGTIAFQYFEREVPKGYEHTLTIYYLADREPAPGLPAWQRLPTLLDTDENLAAAAMPQLAQGSQGIYALMATVAMPVLQPTWNLFAYPIPGERAVANALAAVAGAYTSVYRYDATAPAPWALYDATVVAQHPDYAFLVNDLTTLQFGHAYWLYATQTITPYLGIGGSAASGAALADALLPPATFYGPLEGEAARQLTAGQPIQAYVGGVLCGAGTMTQFNGRWIYKLQVAAATAVAGAGNSCGYLGAPVTFTVSGNTVAEQPRWDNRQAQYQPLTAPVKPLSVAPGAGSHRLFLPLLQR
jgi:hypothetical protein